MPDYNLVPFFTWDPQNLEQFQTEIRHKINTGSVNEKFCKILRFFEEVARAQFNQVVI